MVFWQKTIFSYWNNWFLAKKQLFQLKNQKNPKKNQKTLWPNQKKQKKTIFCKPWEGWGGWTQLAMVYKILFFFVFLVRSNRFFGFLLDFLVFLRKYKHFTKNQKFQLKFLVFYQKPVISCEKIVFLTKNQSFLTR